MPNICTHFEIKRKNKEFPSGCFINLPQANIAIILKLAIEIKLNEGLMLFTLCLKILPQANPFHLLAQTLNDF